MKVLNIRGIDEDVARQFSAGAAIRGVTQAEFIGRLLALRNAASELLEYVPNRPFDSCGNVHHGILHDAATAFAEMVTSLGLEDMRA